MEWTSYRAVLFDLDGVLTPTADVHMTAWSEMFNAYLASLRDSRADATPSDAADPLRPYTDVDYFAYVDGRPRYDGVRAFLASRGIELTDGHPTDPTTAETVCGLGNRKNELFNTVLHRDGVEPYPGSVALLDALAGTDVQMAVVSSSANARPVLTAAGLLDRFPVVVDGIVTRGEALPGKPAPDTYLFGAHQLGVTAAEAVVVEDAISGVAAGRAGEFGLVVGVDRGVGEAALRTAGADIVITDLEELV